MTELGDRNPNADCVPGKVGAGLAVSFRILTLIFSLLVPSLTPQDSTFEYHKNDFPDQRREPGFQAYVPWVHNNSAMSRLICSILKIYIVSTALSVWPE